MRYGLVMLLRGTDLMAIVGTRRLDSSDRYQSELGPFAKQTQRVLQRATSLPPRNLTVGLEVDVEHVDFVGRFESFENDARTLVEQLGIPAVLPPANHSWSTGHGPVVAPQVLRLLARRVARPSPRDRLV